MNIIDNIFFRELAIEEQDIIMSFGEKEIRKSILSLIYPNRVDFLEIRNLLGNKEIPILRNIHKLNRYLNINDGICTPLTLVNNILDKLPNDVWKNPKLKWLDSSLVTGNFIFIVIKNLMNGLKEWEPNKKKRYKHIVENMIFIGDAKPINIFLYLCIVDPKNTFKTNTFNGNFLNKDFDLHKKEIWKIEKFDIIVGNPPYNKGRTSTGNGIWDKFVIKYLGILKQNGYLAMVHPTLWRKPQSSKSRTREINSLMMRKQILYLEMHNVKDGLSTFNKGTRYDFYILENCDIYKKTIINDEDRLNSEISLKNYNFIPNKKIEFLDKLLRKGDDEVCPIIYSRTNYGADMSHVRYIKDPTHIYPLIHTTPKNGTRVMYSSINNKGHFGVSKIIFGDSGIYDVIIDMEGIYGMTHHSRAIAVDSLEEAENIKRALLCNNFRIFLESVLWSNYQIDWALFQHLKRDFWKEFI
jgi:hypothetical protein